MLGVVNAWIQDGIVSKIKLYSKLLTPRKVIGGIGDGLSSIFSCCSSPTKFYHPEKNLLPFSNHFEFKHIYDPYF